MTHGLEWDRPLRYRRGGYTYLDDIDVYYDFDWVTVCGHDRSQFRNGQCLALLARERCPDGKVPTLLLTERTDVPEGSLSTDGRFFLVVNLPRYLTLATGNAAISYYARELHYGIALGEVASRPEIIEAHLTVQRVADWVAASPGRREQLQEALGVDETSATNADSPTCRCLTGAGRS
jgi:hypothetical protein